MEFVGWELLRTDFGHGIKTQIEDFPRHRENGGRRTSVDQAQISGIIGREFLQTIRVELSDGSEYLNRYTEIKTIIDLDVKK